MRKFISLIFPVLFCVLTLQAQTSLSSFRHITIEDGLSSNHVRSLMQDSAGFIWAGTDKGICRYDGISFRRFSLQDRFTGATTMALLEDGPVIWVGTDRGLFRFYYSSEEIKEFGVATEDGVTVSCEVNSIRKDRDGNIWFSTRGQGVFRYNEKAERLDRYEFPSCDDNLSNVYIDRANQVWVLTNWGDPMLSRLNKNTDKFEEFSLYIDGKRLVCGGLAIIEDASQRLWIGTWDEGLFEIDRVTGHITRHLHTMSQGIRHIHSMIEYEHGVLAISSDDGILIYDTDNRTTELISESPVPFLGLSNRFVYPLLKDKEGGLWAGTYYRGLNYHSSFAGQFAGYTHNRFNPNTVGGKVISHFCEDEDHNVWMASDDGGLSCFDAKKQKFRNYTSANSGLTYDNVHALCVDGNDLWIGTYTGGVNVMDMKSGKFRVYMPVSDDETSIDGTSSYAIMKDKDGQIWVATMEGINLYDRKNDCFKRMCQTSSHVIDIDQDGNGNIWFSTLGGGAIRFDPSKEQWRTYRRIEKYGAIPSDYVSCGYVDSNGLLWLCTAAGLVTYDNETDSFHKVLPDSGMSDISGIVEDQHIYWITSAKGLYRYDPNGGLQIFSTSDGLRSTHFTTNSIFKASDGRIYIGTTNGFNTFYPYNIRTNHVVPDVAVVGLTVDNEQISIDDDIIKSPIALGGGSIELTHDKNALTIQFAALSYCVPEKNRYAYILEGFDKTWNLVDNQRHATYTNLPAGRYTFKVRGSNNDNVWNEEPAVLQITVRPHPLLSTPFKILYSLLVIFLIGTLILIAIRFNNRKHEKTMAELNDRKEKEVYEAKIKFFTMIAHEIRTPVSLIIGPLENILKKYDQIPDKVKEDLRTMDRNSQRLLYLVNQLLDFRKVEQEAMVMKFETQPVIPLLHSICERFESTIVQNGARFEVEYPLEDFDVCVDTEAATKLVSNLLTNASKYTKDLVRLSCYKSADNPDMFCITVYDNGCGISREEQTKIFLPFYQTLENKPGTGIGLSLVKSIAELHRGSVKVESETGKYSSFTVVLPLCQDRRQEQEEVATTEGSDARSGLDDILSADVVELKPEFKPIIMIVDDNEDIVKFLSDTLREQYEILTASEGNEALSLLEEYPDVAVIIADWMMPGMDGIELCKSVRANMSLSHISYLLLTAKTDDSSKVIGMDCGADAYIEKPFSVEYLEACIKNQLVMRAILRRRYSSLPFMPLTTVVSTNADNRFLLMLTNLIETHLSDSNLTVDFLTEQMGVSRSSFYNKIKTLTDNTPNELIQMIRLKKAAQLLAERKYRINEICYMVGFSNPSYFSKCFAKQFGMKPGEFMAKSTDK